MYFKEIVIVARKNSNYNGKSGGAGFLITAGIIFLALKGLPGLLLGVVIGAGVGAVASIMGSKLDTTTHNKRDMERLAHKMDYMELGATENYERLFSDCLMFPVP